eukprot:SAG31_NODE_1601_length_7786_cov_33.553272_7_plen_84_part_00
MAAYGPALLAFLPPPPFFASAFRLCALGCVVVTLKNESSRPIHGDTFSISALHLSTKVPYFSNSGHKNEKVTSYLANPWSATR